MLRAVEAWVGSKYGVASGADEVHTARCADGLDIVLKRFAPDASSTSAARHYPVLCVPGLGADSHNFDAPAPLGLARHLADHGFDTWVIDLRGTGQSSIHDDARWSAVTFDDFVEQDLPAALTFLQSRTGAEAVHGLGHSMGGMIFYAHLGRAQASSAPQVQSLITLGSPVGFSQGIPARSWARPFMASPARTPNVKAGRWLRAAAPLLMRRGTRPFTRNLAGEGTLDAAYFRRLAHHAVQDVPRGLLGQFRQWVLHDRFMTVDGRHDYRAALDGVRTPTLIVSGPRDRVARPKSVLRAKALLPAAEVFIASRASGLRHDYGHIDVIFGKHAPEEVFGRLVRFFDRHDAPSQAESG